MYKYIHFHFREQKDNVYKPKGRFFWFVFNALIHWCLCWNMPKACPYVVMWFVPSLMVVGMNHRILSRLTQISLCGSFWAHTDSTRFNEKMVCGNLCWFVADLKNHESHEYFFCWIRAIILVESCWICVRVFCSLRGSGGWFFVWMGWGILLCRGFSVFLW